MLWWVATLAWTIVIFILSTRAFGMVWSNHVLERIVSHLPLVISSRLSLDIQFFTRKLAHVVEYAILALLLYCLVRPPSQRGWHPRTAFISVLAGALYAASDELHQLFVPDRLASMRDWALDVAGVTLGTLTTYFLVRLSPAKSKRNAASSESTEAK